MAATADIVFYEKKPLERNLLMNILTYPFVVVSARYGEWIHAQMRGMRHARVVLEKATTASALEIMTRNPPPIKSWETLKENYLWRLRIAAGVRNREILVGRKLLGAGQRHFEKHPNEELRISVLACGFAAASLNCAARWILLENRPCRVMLFDKDEKILARAMEHARRLGIEQWVLPIQGSMNSEADLKIVFDFEPHIVEIVGFIEYRPDDRVGTIIGMVRGMLPIGGTLITGNATDMPKIHQRSIHNLKWPIIFRKPSETIALVRENLFDPHPKGELDPTGWFLVVEATK